MQLGFLLSNWQKVHFNTDLFFVVAKVFMHKEKALLKLNEITQRTWLN